MTLPNFLIIGAERSGTTSLYQYLRQHPQIFMCPIKEPNFFAYDDALDRDRPDFFPVRSLAEYEALFSGATDEQAIGEASTLYLYRPAAAERIKERLPDVKLIAILRDPAERSYAGYLYALKRGRERRSFAEAVRAGRDGALQSYLDIGFYHRKLTPYAEWLDRGKLALYLYEDYRRDPAMVLRRMFAFLAVDDAFVPDMSVKHNVSGLPRSKLLERLLRRNSVTRTVKRRLPDWARRAVDDTVSSIHRRNRVKPAIDPEVRQDLIAFYRDDILKLQDLIRRDLSAWLK